LQPFQNKTEEGRFVVLCIEHLFSSIDLYFTVKFTQILTKHNQIIATYHFYQENPEYAKRGNYNPSIKGQTTTQWSRENKERQTMFYKKHDEKTKTAKIT
jgi:hypothetical protein